MKLLLALSFAITSTNAVPCLVNERINDSGVCTPCQPNSTRALGDDPANDPTETFCTCDIGFWVDENTAYATGVGTCKTCVDSSNNRSTAQAWDTDETGQTAVNTCTTCAANYVGDGTVCDTPCPAGQASLAGRLIDAALTCTHCAVGHFTTDATAANCTPCTGTGVTTSGITQADGGSATEADVCVTCAADHHVSSNVCTACPTGHTNSPGNDMNGADTICDGCSAGYKSSGTATPVCSLCEEGTTSLAAPNTQANGATTCDICNITTYSDPDNGTCVTCATGYQAASNDSLVCEVCVDGYTNAGGACNPCAAGKHLASNPTIANWADESDDVLCDTCTVGYHANADGSDCVSCPAGTTNTAMATMADGGSSADCDYCQINYYLSAVVGDVTTYECTACEPGTINTGTTQNTSANATTGCPKCDEDYYVSSEGICTACGVNQTITAGSLIAGGENSCSCKANHFVSSNVCTACPAGYSRAAGDDPSGADTVCYGCAEGFFADEDTDGNFVCVQCTDGKSRAAHLNATQVYVAETTCDVCAANYKGNDSANGCVACTGVTTNIGLTSQSSATCTVCAENHYVLSNTCTPCANGHIRAAGDDPTSIDTACVADTPAPTPAPTPATDDGGDTDTPTTTPTTAPTDASSAAAIGIAAAVAAAVPLIL